MTSFKFLCLLMILTITVVNGYFTGSQARAIKTLICEENNILSYTDGASENSNNTLNVSITDISDSKAKITWKAITNLEKDELLRKFFPPIPSRYKYRLSWTGVIQWSQDTRTFGIDGSKENIYWLTNLSPYSNYSVQVTSEEDQELKGVNSFQTLSGVPGPPLNVETKLGTPNSSSIEVNWGIPPDRNGVLGPYTVSWQIKGAENTLNSSDINSLSMTIENLLPCGTYVVKVAASTVDQNAKRLVGDAVESEQKLEKDVPPPVTNLSAAVQSSTVVKLSWIAPQTQCEIVKYRLQITGIILWNDLEDNSELELDADDVKDDEYYVIKLTPYTKYTFCLTPSTDDFEANTTCTGNDTTFEGRPSQPTLLQTEVVSPSSLKVTWEEPVRKNGIIKEYTVSWFREAIFISSVSTKEFEHTIENLSPCYNYTIDVTASTSAGQGVPAIKRQEFKQIEVSSVKNLSCTTMGPDVISISWAAPDGGCPVSHYIVGGIGTVLWSDEIVPITDVTSDTHATLTGLIPYTNYSIHVGILTNANETKPEDSSCFAVTDEDVSGPPEELMVVDDSRTSNSLKVSWEVPEELNGKMIDFVVLWNSQHKFVEFHDLTRKYDVTLEDLDANTDYDVSVQGRNGAGMGTADSTTGSTKKSSAILTVAIVIPIAALIALLSAIFLVKGKYKNALTKRIRRAYPSTMEDPTESEIPPPISLSDVKAHIISLQSNGNLEKEFSNLSNFSKKRTINEAKKYTNATKNRYANILPYDITRVILRSPGTGYINASHMSSFLSPKYFIGTQGPQINTISDFWHMIWQENVDTIVMLTQLIEGGREKCCKYWPNSYELPMKVKNFTVQNIFEENQRWFTHRKCTLTTSEISKKIEHFECNTWPEFGAPITTELLLSIVKAIKSSFKTNRKNCKILVHCSAGVGRTGTLIGLWNIMEQVDDGQRFINVPEDVVKMRRQRPNMVQSMDQYLYLYKCVNEYIQNRKKWELFDGNIQQCINPAFTTTEDDAYVGNLI